MLILHNRIGDGGEILRKQSGGGPFCFFHGLRCESALCGSHTQRPCPCGEGGAGATLTHQRRSRRSWEPPKGEPEPSAGRPERKRGERRSGARASRRAATAPLQRGARPRRAAGVEIAEGTEGGATAPGAGLNKTDLFCWGYFPNKTPVLFSTEPPVSGKNWHLRGSNLGGYYDTPLGVTCDM